MISYQFYLGMRILKSLITFQPNVYILLMLTGNTFYKLSIDIEYEVDIKNDTFLAICKENVKLFNQIKYYLLLLLSLHKNFLFF